MYSSSLERQISTVFNDNLERTDVVPYEISMLILLPTKPEIQNKF